MIFNGCPKCSGTLQWVLVKSSPHLTQCWRYPLIILGCCPGLGDLANLAFHRSRTCGNQRIYDGYSHDGPKTEASHYARGGASPPVGTVGQSGSGRVDAETQPLPLVGER
jgi:hypothetical protein